MRILIADDSDVVRRGVCGILSSENDFEVCGEAKNGSEALQKARELLPDLILLDISMPGMNGLEVARRLREEVRQAKILIISQHDPLQLLSSVNSRRRGGLHRQGSSLRGFGGEHQENQVRLKPQKPRDGLQA